MLPLYQELRVAFRFEEDRLLARFHLESVSAGQRVSVFKVDPGTGERLDLLATGTVGEGGWVELDDPISVRAGEVFLAVPDPLNSSPGKMLPWGIGVVGVLALAGYLAGLTQGVGERLLLAVCCAALGGFIVLLGYGPIALVIGALGALANWFPGKKRRKDSGEEQP